MSVSNVLGEAWELYTRLFVRTVVVAAIVFSILELVSALAGTIDTRNTGALIALTAVAVVLTVVGPEIVQGAMAHAVRDVHEGLPPASPGALVARTLPRAPALIVGAWIAGLGIVLGFVLLVIPGLILATRWALIAPCIVLEDLGPNAARRRSRQLVSGHGWTVFGVLVVTFLLTGAFQFVIVAASAALPAFYAAWIGGTVASCLTAPFSAHAIGVMYYRLAEPQRPVIPPARKSWDSVWDEEARVQS